MNPAVKTVISASLWIFVGLLPISSLAEEPAETTRSSPAQAVPQSSEEDESLTAEVSVGVKRQDSHVLVEEFTAQTLAKYEWKVGTDLEVGLTDRLMVGTDLVALSVGVPSLQGKIVAAQGQRHIFALGLRAAYLDKSTFLWGESKDHWQTLKGEIIRPSVAWTHVLSSRLKLHTFWGKGIGKITAELSEKGRRKLCETKHNGDECDQILAEGESDGPKEDGGLGQDEDDDGDVDDVESDQNLEKSNNPTSNLTSQSIQVQSLTGLAQDRFQITGEFSRANGNKILVTSRIEQTVLEELKSNFFRLTIAHQWIWSSFQMRLGIGTQYFVMTGRDLDGEKIDESGVQPASDISFYWRF